MPGETTPDRADGESWDRESRYAAERDNIDRDMANGCGYGCVTLVVAALLYLLWELIK